MPTTPVMEPPVRIELFLAAEVKKPKPSPSCTNASREITGDDSDCGQNVGKMWATEPFD
jgi:hypothetical protein